MNSFTELYGDEVGVSPVIGVILMVAVTVILAAVIGSFVLGLGSSIQETPPQAQFEIETLEDYTPETKIPSYDAEITAVKITHMGGEDVDFEDLRIEVDGKQAYANDPDSDPSPNGYPGPVYPWQDTDTISTGQSTTLVMATDYIEDNDMTVDPTGTERILFDWGNNPGRIWHDGSWRSEPKDDLLESGQEVRIVWDPGNGESYTLQTADIS